MRARRWPFLAAPLLALALVACGGQGPLHAQEQDWATTVKQDVKHVCVDAKGNKTDAGTYDQLHVQVWNWDPKFDRKVTVSTRTDPPAKGEKDKPIFDGTLNMYTEKDLTWKKFDYRPEQNPGSTIDKVVTLPPNGPDPDHKIEDRSKIQITIIDHTPANWSGDWNVLDHTVFNNECPKDKNAAPASTAKPSGKGDPEDCNPATHAGDGMQNSSVRHRCLKARGFPENYWG